MLKYLVGPLVGALIGYCTNYIAVKMLFRPRHEVYILGHKLPLTPGAIPKGKPRLARAVGEVISTYLVTQEDIEAKVLSPAAEQAVVDKIMEVMDQEIRQDLYSLTSSGDEYETLVKNIDEACTNKILEKLHEADLETIIREKGSSLVMEKLGTSMIGMFLSEPMLDSLLAPVAEGVSDFIDTKGAELIRPEVSKTLSGIRDESLMDIAEKANLYRDDVREKLTNMYREVVKSSVPKMMEKLDIANMIRQKIDDMEVEQLEELVMAVMKKELNTIVNLGALIGLLLGTINLFF